MLRSVPPKWPSWSPIPPIWWWADMRIVASRPVAASGLEPALDLLPPPLAAGAGFEVVPLVEGKIATGRSLRAPAVLLRLKVAQAREAVVVTATVAGAELGPVVFTAWSAAGSLLPLYVPDAEGIGPAELTVAVRLVHGDAVYDPATAIAAAEPVLDAGHAEFLVEAVLLEGYLARSMHLLTEEKQRLTAAAREVAAARHVGLARLGALDAIGADHGVPRLADESDDQYRARLSIYTSWRIATPAGFARALNGGGSAGDDNSGLPSTVGVADRFRIVEQAEQLAVAVRLVEIADPQRPPEAGWRKKFVELAQQHLLFDLETLPPQQLPPAVRDRQSAVRKLLRDNLDRAQPITERRYLSVMCATALARAVQLLAALTGTGQLTLLSAMTRDIDERLDLGLGVALAPLEPARIDAAVATARAAHDAAATGQPVGLPDVPGDVVSTILAAEIRDRAEDPDAAWIFEAAGLTLSRIDPQTVYVTPLPTQGLTIEGPGRLELGKTGQFVARMRGDAGGRHVLVDETWAHASGRLVRGGPALAPADLESALRAVGAADPPPPPPVEIAPLVGQGFAVGSPGDLARRLLDSYDLDLVVGYRTDVPAPGVPVDDPAAVAARGELIADLSTLTDAGFDSVRILAEPNGIQLLVIASVSALPGGSSRPDEPAPAMYRWYVAPFPPPQPTDDGGDWSFGAGGRRLRIPNAWPRPAARLRRGNGGRAQLDGLSPGIALVVCVAYLRRGLADPYEVRLELPDGAVLNPDQYGYLANLLEHVCPVGIEINTYELRRHHISVDGAPPQPLSANAGRGYLRYRQRRQVGAERHDPMPVPSSEPT